MQYDGVTIKYSGPGILCFFSGAEHRKRAIQAAISAKAASSAPLKIGIATGPICFGTIGQLNWLILYLNLVAVKDTYGQLLRVVSHATHLSAPRPRGNC